MSKTLLTDALNSRMYMTEAFTGSVYASLALAAGSGVGTYGIAVDGTQIMHSDDTSTFIHVVGWTASISSSFANAHPSQRDLYWDGTNLQAGAINGGAGHCTKYTGKTSTVLADFSDGISDGHMKSCNQVAGAGNTMCSTGDILRQFQTYSGFTGTRVSNFNFPIANFGNHGGEWDGTNYLAVVTLADFSQNAYKLSGFTSTLLAVIAAPTTEVRGIAWSPSAFDATFKSAVGVGVGAITAVSFITPYLIYNCPTSTAITAVLVQAALATLAYSVSISTTIAAVLVLAADAILGNAGTGFLDAQIYLAAAVLAEVAVLAALQAQGGPVPALPLEVAVRADL